MIASQGTHMVAKQPNVPHTYANGCNEYLVVLLVGKLKLGGGLWTRLQCRSQPLPTVQFFITSCMHAIKSKASTSLLATLDEMGTRLNENKLGTQHCFFFLRFFIHQYRSCRQVEEWLHGSKSLTCGRVLYIFTYTQHQCVK